MSQIRAVYSHGVPSFPATDQHRDAERFTVGPYIVDAIGGAPTIDEIEAFLAPPAPKRTAQEKLQAFLAANPDVVALIDPSGG